MSVRKIQPSQKITPFLWFDSQAEEAARFYISIFTQSKIVRIARVTEEAAAKIGQKEGAVLTVEFELEGQRFVGLNGGPAFKFNESISFFVSCKTQAEVDKYWKRLSAGGETRECGWLRDKYGVFWQIVPTIMLEWLSGKDTAKAGRVMEAMLRMTKLDIKKLKEAAR